MNGRNAAKWWGTVAAAMFVLMGNPIHAEEGATIGAMQVAYSREVNARAQYVAYAVRADLEGQPAAACLFRAVADAEAIHAARHAAAIEQLNAKPVARMEDVLVLGTAHNLKTAILSEMQERSVVYPRLADYVRAEHRYEALASCIDAMGAEVTHERAFRAALWRLEQEQAEQVETRLASLDPMSIPMVPVPVAVYYLCPGDGCISAKPYARCANCGTAGDQAIRYTSWR